MYLIVISIVLVYAACICVNAVILTNKFTRLMRFRNQSNVAAFIEETLAATFAPVMMFYIIIKYRWLHREYMSLENYLRFKNVHALMSIGMGGSGKTYLAEKLRKYGIQQALSYTTRPARPGEINGVHYQFIDESKFRELQEQGFFSEVQHFNGWYYGYGPITELRYSLMVITPQGLDHYQSHHSEFYSRSAIMFNKPKLDIIRARLNDRVGSTDSAQRRFEADLEQFKNLKHKANLIIFKHDFKVEQVIHEILDMIDHKSIDNRRSFLSRP